MTWLRHIFILLGLSAGSYCFRCLIVLSGNKFSFSTFMAPTPLPACYSGETLPHNLQKGGDSGHPCFISYSR